MKKMGIKERALIVVMFWAFALFFTFCCTNVILDIIVLAGIITSNVILKHYAPELHDEIFRPN